MNDVLFLHVEKELVMIDGRRVGAIRLDKEQPNVLTHIQIEEDERGKGYARDAVEAWLQQCDNDGFEEAYVINVNHAATEHIFETLQHYDASEVLPRSVPADTTSGPHISSLCYRIDLTVRE